MNLARPERPVGQLVARERLDVLQGLEGDRPRDGATVDAPVALGLLDLGGATPQPGPDLAAGR